MKLDETIEFSSPRLSENDKKTGAADFAKSITTNLARMLNSIGKFAVIDVITDQTSGAKTDSYDYKAEISVDGIGLRISGTSVSGGDIGTSESFAHISLVTDDGLLSSDSMIFGAGFYDRNSVSYRLVLLANDDAFFVAVTNASKNAPYGGNYFMILNALDVFTRSVRKFGAIGTGIIGLSPSDFDGKTGTFLDLNSTKIIAKYSDDTTKRLINRSDGKIAMMDVYRDNGRLKIKGIKEITPNSHSYLLVDGVNWFTLGRYAISF